MTPLRSGCDGQKQRIFPQALICRFLHQGINQLVAGSESVVRSRASGCRCRWVSLAAPIFSSDTVNMPDELSANVILPRSACKANAMLFSNHGHSYRSKWPMGNTSNWQSGMQAAVLRVAANGISASCSVAMISTGLESGARRE